LGAAKTYFRENHGFPKKGVELWAFGGSQIVQGATLSKKTFWNFYWFKKCIVTLLRFATKRQQRMCVFLDVLAQHSQLRFL
jgi:hypothetical protein